MRAIIVLGLFLVMVDLVYAENKVIYPVHDSSNQQTLLNNVTDFFSTVGRSQITKEESLKRRKEARARYRLGKERIKKDIRAKQRAAQNQKIVMDKIKAINNSKLKSNKPK